MKKFTILHRFFTLIVRLFKAFVAAVISGKLGHFFNSANVAWNPANFFLHSSNFAWRLTNCCNRNHNFGLQSFVDGKPTRAKVQFIMVSFRSIYRVQSNYWHVLIWEKKLLSYYFLIQFLDIKKKEKKNRLKNWSGPLNIELIFCIRY